MFGKSNDGGLMDVIRCDQQEYLIWKWSPAGQANTTAKENSIRFGSSLRVKTGEVAVFVYKSGEDYIVGPYDKILETANFPVLASIIGAAWGGKSPFQAEVYFINQAGVMQIPIGVPWFDVVDPEFPRLGVPVAVRGMLTFNIPDYKAFVKKHGLRNFDLETFKNRLKSAMNVDIKDTVARVPEYGIPILRVQSRLRDLREIILNHLRQEIEGLFNIKIERADIDAVEIDKEHPNWVELEKVAARSVSLSGERMVKMANAQDDTTIQNMKDTQRINAANMEEMARIQREEMQHSQRMQTDSANIPLHQLNQQTRVAMAGAEALGKMGEGGAMNMGGGGMNPAGMMAGMMMVGAVAGQMGGMMNNMMQGMQQPQQGAQPPASGMPPPPLVQYNIAINGQTTGPFDMNTLAQMAQNGQLTPQSQVWKQGMAGWAAAGTVQELSGLFAQNTPPPPPPPPAP